MNEQFSHRGCIDGEYLPVPRRRELGLLDEGTREILSAAKDDKPLAVILSAAKDLLHPYE